MLVLTRRTGQSLLVGGKGRNRLAVVRKDGSVHIIEEPIQVKVVRVRGVQIRLGVQAHDDLLVLREELLENVA